jgi:hypothetical protein
MRRANRPSPALCLIALLFAAPVPLYGQFGTKELSTVIPSASFMPGASAHTYFNEGFTYFQATAGNPAVFLGPLNLPAGAKLNQVCGFIRDDDATNDVTVDVAVIELGDAAVTPSVTNLATVTSSGTPHYQMLCAFLPANTTIRAFGDGDGAGGNAYLSYRIAVTLRASGDLAFGGALLKWQRQQAPAPAVATFADVPTNFLFFRAIENLAAAGITGGCSPGNYCPNANITRGEAAAFFSKALGLSFQQ